MLIHAVAYSAIAIWLLTYLGNWLCRNIFQLTGLKDAIADMPDPGHNAGRVIGALERLLLAVGIILQSWEILASVIALKTVARFKAMDEQRFAEYFLVGSLFSIFWALLITSLWMGYDHRFGVDLRQKATIFIGREEKTGESK